MAIVERDRIQQVIHCSWWQERRLSLKGLDTVDKLTELRKWLDDDKGCQLATYNNYNKIDKPRVYKGRPIVHVRSEVCGWTERRDQVLNYLTALSRGGQIEALAYEVWHDAVVTRVEQRYGDINWDLIVVRKVR